MPTAPTPTGVLDGVDVDAIAAAAVSCPGVAGLTAGRFGDVVTYLPGRQVPGVRVAAEEVTVQVTARWGEDAHSVWQQINTATGRMRHNRRLHLVIADIDLPPDGEVTVSSVGGSPGHGGLAAGGGSAESLAP